MYISLWMVLSAVVLHPAAVRGDVLSDTSGEQWAGYGRTYDESHFSPLVEINSSNVAQLGLAWWLDIPGVVQASSVPLEVSGTLYFATGYSVIRAVDALSGRLLWKYDPGVTKVAGHKLRLSWGIRGIAYWNDKIYTGTHDGRLIALDAKTGKLVWSVVTTEPGDLRVICGPPLAFKGKVVIGHTGDYGPPMGRPYVTAYDAETGRKLWRFYTVPGDPKKGFESTAMEMAAKTWSGEWWKYGGGGAVWNAMAYDPELNRVYLGTSNGYPFNQKIRSPGGGDNLFVASIVALDADTGTYVWHYQTNPGDMWDFDAAEDIELANVVIDGKPRRVLMQASKNGFFYVVDRENGKLLGANEFAKVTWAERIDLTTGRPVETPNARYQTGETTIWPGGVGAHSWQPMAFNPKAGLAYIPVQEVPAQYSDKGMDVEHWKPDHSSELNLGVAMSWIVKGAPANEGFLLAWDPVSQRSAWRIRLPCTWNGGTGTTAGNLVFQGRCDGQFVAYAADSGKVLWSFDAQAGVTGAPITYRAGGRQYVSIMAGFGGFGAVMDPMRWNARTQPRRLLTFSLGGNVHLPAAPSPYRVIPVTDPDFGSNTAAEQTGAKAFGQHCLACHGVGAVAGGTAPDLRASPTILSSDAFSRIVRGGALVAHGMPRFEEFSDEEIEGVRQYVRSRARDLVAKSRSNGSAAGTESNSGNVPARRD